MVSTPVDEIAGEGSRVDFAAVTRMAGYAVAVVLGHRTASPRVDALQLAISIAVRVPVFGNTITLPDARPLLEIAVWQLRLRLCAMDNG